MDNFGKESKLVFIPDNIWIASLERSSLFKENPGKVGKNLCEENGISREDKRLFIHFHS